MELVIITGMSGAGKNTCSNILEDLGYLCVDNIPFSLIESCIDLYAATSKSDKISFTLDIRGQEELSGLMEVVRTLKQKADCDCKLIFLDAKDDVIVARYQESRHLHPWVLTKKMTLTEALVLERKQLSELREAADMVLDTSYLRTPETKEKLEHYLSAVRTAGMMVTCMSFGFKHGAPSNVDLLFDVRCFPNPHYIPELRPQTGLDAPVFDYVFSFEDTNRFMDKLIEMIDFLLPKYKAEGKSQLTIGIGCTGGQHRSVAFVERLGRHIAKQNIPVSILHRDMKKGKRK